MEPWDRLSEGGSIRLNSNVNYEYWRASALFVRQRVMNNFLVFSGK